MKTILKVPENTNGLTEGYITDSGTIIRWKDMELSLGLMEENTLENTKTIKNTDKEHSNGQMAENTSENGKTENNTEKESTLKKENKEKAIGKWAKELIGLKKRNDNEIELNYYKTFVRI